MFKTALFLLIVIFSYNLLYAGCVTPCIEYTCRCGLSRVDYEVYDGYDRLPFPTVAHKTTAYPKAVCIAAGGNDEEAATHVISVQVTRIPWTNNADRSGHCAPITSSNYTVINSQLTSYQAEIVTYERVKSEREACEANPAITSSCSTIGGVCEECLAIVVPPHPTYPPVRIDHGSSVGVVMKYQAVACWSQQPGCSTYCSGWGPTVCTPDPS